MLCVTIRFVLASWYGSVAESLVTERACAGNTHEDRRSEITLAASPQNFLCTSYHLHHSGRIVVSYHIDISISLYIC
jgi:hypothetical protein